MLLSALLPSKNLCPYNQLIVLRQSAQWNASGANFHDFRSWRKAVVRRFSLTSIGGCQVSTASGELDATHLMIGPVLELPYCQ